MKFGKKIEQGANAEWKTQFIDYQGLKDILKAWKRGTQDVDSSDFDYDLNEDSGLFLDYLKQNADLLANPHMRKFMESMQTELDKVNNFYIQQEQKCEHRQEELQDQVKCLVRFWFLNSE